MGCIRNGRGFPGQFPPRLRVAVAIQAAVLGRADGCRARICWLAAARANAGCPWLIWIAVAFSAVAAVLNTITRNVSERRLWAPITYGMLTCSLIVALMA